MALLINKASVFLELHCQINFFEDFCIDLFARHDRGWRGEKIKKERKKGECGYIETGKSVIF